MKEWQTRYDPQPILEPKPTYGSTDKPLIQVGVFSETDRLKVMARYGLPGVSAYMAQHLPLSISCFLQGMDVFKSRAELAHYADVLETKHGVELISVTDKWADILQKPHDLSKKQILDKLFRKSKNMQDAYGTHDPYYQDIITRLVELDSEYFSKNGQDGEAKALALAQASCLDIEKPLGNLQFTQDPWAIIDEDIVWASMKHPIRRAEVEIYQRAMLQAIKPSRMIRVPANESLEGGDVLLHNHKVMIGVGTRTTLGAARFVFEHLGHKMEERGFKFLALVDTKLGEKTPEQQMEDMHSDTWFNLVSEKEAAVCLERAATREVYFLDFFNGEVVVKPSGISFDNYLGRQGYSIIPITLEEQLDNGSNFNAIDDKTKLVPKSKNTGLIARLKEAGQEVEVVPMDETTNSYGGTHCVSKGIVRKVA